MVGVQRSKACISCIRRKKGCDKQKPACGQCRKACIPCQGYDRPRTFINNSIEPDVDCRKKNKENQTGAKRLDTTHIFSQEQVLARSASEARILELFWRLYFPDGLPLPTDVACSTLGGWMNNIQYIYTTDNTVRKAILTMALSTVGRQDESCGSMREGGRRLYGDALKDVSVMLRMPRKRQENELLVTVRLFSLFEAVHGEDSEDGEGTSLTQARRWLAHSVGDSALVMDRGPMAFVSGYSHRLFVDGRLHLIMAAIQDRKKTFLGETAWKTIPWSNSQKSPKDYLLDILGDVPSLFEDMDKASSSRQEGLDSSNTKTKYQSHRLYDELLRIQTSLAQWNEDYSSCLLTISDEQDDTGQDVVINPRSLATAHISTLYWSICIVLHGIMGKALAAATGRKESSSSNEKSLINLQVLCQQILKIIPVFLHPKTGIFRVHLATFPLSVVKMYLAMSPPKSMMEERALLTKHLQDPACSTMRKLMASMNR